MITQQQAEKVRDEVEAEFQEHNIGSAIRPGEDGNWYVVLYLKEELPTDTFPNERGGVKILPEVIGDVRLQ